MKALILKFIRKNSWFILIAVWLGLVGYGFSTLFSFSFTAMVLDKDHKSWPEKSKLTSVIQDKPALIVFLHPRCTCSYASLSELERIIPFVKNRAKVYIVFYEPKERSQNWLQTRLWKAAKNIPGVEVKVDENGEESRLFGAKVSGEVMLFDLNGNRIFHGGITPGRGHEGESTGKNSLISFFQNGSIEANLTPAFGCALLGKKHNDSID